MDSDYSFTELAVVYFLYLLPFISVVIYNLFSGRDPYWKKKSIKAAFFVNVFLGWTIIGWLYALRFVWFRPEGLTPMGARGAGGAPPEQPTWPPSQPADRERVQCSSCGGTGKTSCGFCGGQGGRWQLPQTESGTSQWSSCTYCTGSGHISCSSCGGTGRAGF
jgi:hypothetical protein